jgi:ketosteroid isomerase-like protein
MHEQQNIDLVKKLYEAFGKGDIKTITDHLADQLVWRFDAPSVSPCAGKHETPDQVREGFFGALASHPEGLYPYDCKTPSRRTTKWS